MEKDLAAMMGRDRRMLWMLCKIDIVISTGRAGVGRGDGRTRVQSEGAEMGCHLPVIALHERGTISRSREVEGLSAWKAVGIWARIVKMRCWGEMVSLGKRARVVMEREGENARD